jgi:osmoprotectant transport system ATP-binding protein
MREGQLVQFAPPAELLAQPADDFVADFVGADRALKSLSLTRVEELDLLPPPLVRSGETASAVLERIEHGGLTPAGDAVLIVDPEGRPLDWLPLERLRAQGVVPTAAAGGAEPLLDPVTSLRDALSALFETGALFGAVVDPGGRCIGLFSANEIADVFKRPTTPPPPSLVKGEDYG